MKRLALAIAALALIAGCTSAGPVSTPTQLAVSPSMEPTDALSDSTAILTVTLSGRARVSWTDSSSAPKTFEEDAGTHRYGADSWQAEDLTVLTVVPLEEGGSAECRIEMASIDVHQSRVADDATGTSEVAICYATASLAPAKGAKSARATFTATSDIGGAMSVNHNGVRLFERPSAAGESVASLRVTGRASMVTIGLRDRDRVGCTIAVKRGDTDVMEAHGLGGIAMCQVSVN